MNADRRKFLKTAATVALAGTGANSVLASQQTGLFATRIRKAVKYHMVKEKLPALDKLKMLADLGFDGVELRTMLKPSQAAEFKELATASQKLDFPVHGVVNSSNPDIKSAIDQAKILGANSVLHVVRYDREIGYLENYKQTKEIILRAVDHAAKNEVFILLENVWASYLIEPMGMAKFIDEINNPWVKVYFDIGNVVRWGWPQHWIEVLGKRIQKLDVKEYDLGIAMNEGMRKGFGMPLGTGSIDWNKVRKELLKIDYKGWATAEVPGGDRQHLASVAEQMDKVLDLKVR